MGMDPAGSQPASARAVLIWEIHKRQCSLATVKNSYTWKNLSGSSREFEQGRCVTGSDGWALTREVAP